MNRNKLKIAIQEAERFIEKAKALLDPIPYTDPNMKGLFMTYFPKESGVIRRSSMDLTRALSELRKY